MHNGYLNTYSLTKDGKKITLTPLNLSQLQKAKPQKNQTQSELLLACAESVLKASHHEFKAFKDWILLLQEESENRPQLHPLAISLLKRFDHLFL